MAQIVQLTSSPNQKLSVTVQVNGYSIPLQLWVRFNEMAGFWAMDISDQLGNLLLASVPFTTGAWPAANILGAWQHLGIGSAFVIKVSNTASDYPDVNQLGTDFVLLWDDSTAGGVTFTAGAATPSAPVVSGPGSPFSQTPWLQDVNAANYMLYNLRALAVGKASPVYGVDVVGDVNVTGTFRVNGVGLGAGAGGQTPWLQDEDAHQFRLLNASNIGVNTSAPGAPLHVVQPGGVAGDNIWFGNGSVAYPSFTPASAAALVGRGATSDFRIVVQDGGGRVGLQWNAVGSGGGTYIVGNEPAFRLTMSGNAQDTTSGAYIAFMTAPSVATAGSAITWASLFTIQSGTGAYAFISPRGITSDFYISASGQVGVGTTTPAYTLDVNGNLNVSGNLLLKGSAFGQTPWLSNINAAGFSLTNVPTISGNGSITLAAGGAGTLSLNTSSVVRVQVTASGFVGFGGLMTPGYAVDISGDANVSGLYRVGGTPLAASNVVNAVSSIGSYADPVWITSLSATKLTGSLPPSFIASSQTPWLQAVNAAGYSLTNVPQISGNGNLLLAAGGAGSVALNTNSVTRVLINANGMTGFGGNTSPNYAVDATGDINVSGLYRVGGNPLAAVNVANAVSAIGSYGDPVWITSLSASKLTGSLPPTYISAAQTPWLQNISAAGFSLTNVPVIQGNGNIAIGAGGAGTLSLNTSSVTRVQISASGNAGFGGNTTPNYAVDVAGDANVSGIYRIGGTPLAASNIVNAVSTLGSYADPAWITSLSSGKLTGAPPPAVIASAQTPWLQNISAAGFTLSNIPQVTGNGTITLAAGGAGTLSLNTNGVTRLQISASGLVGIGNTSPGYALDVTGDLNISGVYRVGGAPLAAANIVNAVSVTGSYANPAWITSLDYSKVTGSPSTTQIAAMQTPWLQAINGNSMPLGSVSRIGIGAAYNVNYQLFVQGTGISDPVCITNTNASGIASINFASSVAGNTASFGVGNPSAYPAALQNLAFIDSRIIPFLINTNGSVPALYITNDPRIGIGTVSPVYALDVSGDINCTGSLRINGMPLAAAGQTPWGQDVNANSFNLLNVKGISVGKATAPAYPVDVVGDLNITGQFRVNGAVFTAPLTPWTSNINAAGYQLQNAGSIGIGTTSPIVLLDLPAYNTTNSSMRIGSMEFVAYALNNSNWTDNLYYNGGWLYRNTGYGSCISMNSGGINFLTSPSGSAGASAPTPVRMSITNSGNVGIGTNTPSQKLHVVGGGIACGSGAYVYAAGDLGVSRESAPTSGVVYFGNSGSNYLFFNNGPWTLQGGTSFNFATITAITVPTATAQMAIGTSSVAPGPLTVCTNNASYGIRIARTNYGVDLYNDDGNFYILLTASGSPYGGFNGLRPFYINLANGVVTMNQGLAVNGSLTLNGAALTGGTTKACQQIFTASGTFTPSAGLTAAGGWVEVLLVGGGAGGTYTGTTTGYVNGWGGGGGGGVMRRRIQISGAQAVTIGGGGGTGQPGGAGGNTYFGGLGVSGGQPGPYASSSWGGAGGASGGGGPVGTASSGGGPSGPNATPGGGGGGAGGPGGGTAGNANFGGNGGPGVEGLGGGGGGGGTYGGGGSCGGGNGVWLIQNTAGPIAATSGQPNTGGGGGGGGNYTTSANYAGGNGGSGIVIVNWEE